MSNPTAAGAAITTGRRIRKKPPQFVAGANNTGGLNNQLNETGANAFKDPDQKNLTQYFKNTLKPMGWRMDHPPAHVCADYTFVPASLTGVDRKQLYKKGQKGQHYAAEWPGLKAMLDAHDGGLAYAPTLEADDSDIPVDEDTDDDPTVAFGTPAHSDDDRWQEITMTDEEASHDEPATGVARAISASSSATRRSSTTKKQKKKASRVSLSPQQQQATVVTEQEIGMPAATVVQAPAATRSAGAKASSLESLYLHKRLLEEDLARLEGILDDTACPARKRARTERELADQEAHFIIVKKAIVNGHISALSGT